MLALIEPPVSVISTIASAKSGALASVAPQENSTFAVTPCFLRYSSVMLTTSVAMRFPSRSLTLRMSEVSGTASTHRRGCRVCLA